MTYRSCVAWAGLVAAVAAGWTLGIAGAAAAEKPLEKLAPALMLPGPAGGNAPVEGVSGQATVEANDRGEPTLLVTGPTRKLRMPSLQLALVIDRKAEGVPEPLAIPGEPAQRLWREQASALNKPAYEGATEVVRTLKAFLEYGDAKLLSVRGRNTSSGHPGSYGTDDDGRRVVLFLLDAWSDRSGVIRVSLSDLDTAPRYAEPGKLYVWLLDGSEVVWSQTLDWPGKVAPKPENLNPPAAAAKPDTTKPATAVAKPETTTQPPADNAASATPPIRMAPPLGPPGDAAAKAAPAASVAPGPLNAAGPAAENHKPPTVAVNRSRKTVAEMQQMDVGDLIKYIDETWGPSMEPRIRKAWTAATERYSRAGTGDAFRRDILMEVLKVIWNEQPGGELRNAFATLYLKLKGERMAAPK